MPETTPGTQERLSWCGLSPSGELDPGSCSHTPAMTARRLYFRYGAEAARQWRVVQVQIAAIGAPIPVMEAKRA